MTHKALFIAYHFPPLAGSSGMQRTLGFIRHLPPSSWEPILLTVREQAYETCDARQSALIPKELTVHRSFCLDSARHLSIKGRYIGALATPDRWRSWIVTGVIDGLRIIRKYKPQIIWSTYPIATAHSIANTLHRLTGIPWVADFRDPMVERNPRTGSWAPGNRRLRNARLRIESKCVQNASQLVFCTDAAMKICQDRYPLLSRTKCSVITNGFDENLFRLAGGAARHVIDKNSPQLTLLHSGTIYPTADRDPSPMFRAVMNMKARGDFESVEIRIRLRATGHDQILSDLIRQYGIEDIVELAPSIPYMEAIREMQSVDGLLLFQGYTSNPAIPAKLYEYIRSGTPILALVDDQGSTARLLRCMDYGTIAAIENTEDIEKNIAQFVSSAIENTLARLDRDSISKFSRSSLTQELAAIFNNIVNSR